MCSCTFGGGGGGGGGRGAYMYVCPVNVCTVCIWRCKHARFCVEVFMHIDIYKFSFISVG